MRFWQVDAFTEKRFGGNPAAVFVTTEALSDELMQQIATEMNLSETAFVQLGGATPLIRWFTPKSEVNLCGHATLAAAHVLWAEGFISGERVDFDCKSGFISVRQIADGKYALDFPQQPAQEKAEYQSRLESILGVKPIYIGSNGEDCLVVVEDDSLVRNLSPNLAKIAELPERGLILSAKDRSGKDDIIYRGFFPKLDVPEDPATGSAHTILAPYWSRVLGKNSFSSYQASSRGGNFFTELAGERVLISGSAVTVFEGELRQQSNTVCVSV